MQTQENIVLVSTTKGIDVGKIEKELAAMWKPAVESEGSNAESGVTRACALNLLVYATAADDRERIYEMLDAVCEQHPGRTLVLVADRAATEPKLDAYVSTRCRLLGGNRKQICGEQVTIEAAGSAADTAASAIEPLLVPDVPVFLWWKDIPHYEDKLFSRMTAMSDRMVIDSSCFDSPHKDLLRLARMIRERPQFMSASDLNWGRLTAWRNLVASFWDVPDYRPYLDKIERIVVEYDPPCFAPDEIAPQSLLAVGWLASRLGWSIEGNGEREENGAASFQLRASGREIKVLMHATKREGYADGILVSLTLSTGDASAEFRVAFSDDRKKLETEARVDGARTVGRVLSYEQKTEGQRLSRELSLLKRDLVYEEALASAAQLIANHGNS
ncbi:MAG TPA: glucose-6-phosphate dehydrogenase assembly protein OpcA [Pyrinomonadaceae bacterium]|jgi:glucose-6-phosphate dehydrogenase assembly protein OpcA|nr:glucose-6-phosphate dehydrogenase assembly protein OpcA [Pyrinomonadaceae bacterium]